MNKEQLIDKLERVVCGQYSYEMQEKPAYSALCCIKGTPDDCAKFPVTRPLPDTLVDVWDEIGQYLGTGKAIETRSCGVSLLLHGTLLRFKSCALLAQCWRTSKQLAIRHWLVGLANCSPAQPVEWTVWMNHLKPVATAAQRGPTGLRAGSSPPGRQTLKNLDPWRS